MLFRVRHVPTSILLMGDNERNRTTTLFLQQIKNADINNIQNVHSYVSSLLPTSKITL